MLRPVIHLNLQALPAVGLPQQLQLFIVALCSVTDGIRRGDKPMLLRQHATCEMKQPQGDYDCCEEEQGGGPEDASKAEGLPDALSFGGVPIPEIDKWVCGSTTVALTCSGHYAADANGHSKRADERAGAAVGDSRSRHGCMGIMLGTLQ